MAPLLLGAGAAQAAPAPAAPAHPTTPGAPAPAASEQPTLPEAPALAAPTHPTTPEAPTPATTAHPATPEAPAPAAPEPQLPAQVAGHTILSLGLSPTAGIGAGMSFGFRWHYSTFAVEGRLLAPLSTFDIRPGQRAEVMLSIGILSWCIESAHPLLICLLPEAGRMNISSTDPQPHIRTPFFVATGARIGVVRSFAHVAHLRAYLEPAVTVVGAAFALDGKTFWSSPFFSIGFGLEFTFGPLDPPTWDAPAVGVKR